MKDDTLTFLFNSVSWLVYGRLFIAFWPGFATKFKHEVWKVLWDYFSATEIGFQMVENVVEAALYDRVFLKFFNRVSGLISRWFLHPVPKFLKGSVEQGLQMSCKSFLCFSVVFFFLMWKRYSNISPRCVTLMISHTEILMKPMLNRLERAGGCCNRFWFGGWKRQN